MSERVIGIPGYINASDTSAILTAVEELWVKFYLNNFKADRILNSVKYIHYNLRTSSECYIKDFTYPNYTVLFFFMI